MFLANTRKCVSLNIFSDVFVSSDSQEILDLAIQSGAKGILRGEELCGDVPNIPVYRHAVSQIGYEPFAIVAVQANSPTLAAKTIQRAKELIEISEIDEVMTCHTDGSIYGSVWALKGTKLKEYDNFYNPCPNVLIMDNSIDVHTLEDYNKLT